MVVQPMEYVAQILWQSISICYTDQVRTVVLRVDASADLVTLDVLFALQPRTENEHLLPRLDRFLWKNTTVDFIP